MEEFGNTRNEKKLVVNKEDFFEVYKNNFGDLTNKAKTELSNLYDLLRNLGLANNMNGQLAYGFVLAYDYSKKLGVVEGAKYGGKYGFELLLLRLSEEIMKEEMCVIRNKKTKNKFDNYS